MKNYTDFTGKVALITGAGSKRGIGFAAAQIMAGYGATVIIADLDDAGAGENAKQICADTGRSDAAIAINVNLTSEDSIKEMTKTAIEKCGKIDILVNNAGISIPTPYNEISLDEWNLVISVNLTSAFLCCREIIPHMQEQKYGRVINVASVAGKNGGVLGGAHYTTTKGGMISMAKCIAKQVAKDNVTVNCVAPGTVKTDGAGVPWEQKKPSESPMQRRAETDEIAYAIVYLASDIAAYNTGSTIDVNGGLYMD